MKSDARYAQLKAMLVARQRVLTADDASDAEIQDDLHVVLTQMKAETLNKIDEALVRLEEGTYGLCFECGDAIALPRLRALPFAVRCKECEEGIEMSQQRARSQARRASSPLGFELRG
jgi:DnaK suppressor protein